MRLFIAIELPDLVKGMLSDLVGELRPKLKGWRWIRVENLHLTIKFLGELDEQDLNMVQECLRVCICKKAIAPIRFQIASIGVFPSIRHPSVLWCGMLEEERVLQMLAADLENDLEKIGFQKEERSFHPHITIARASKKDPAIIVQRDIEMYKERVFAAFDATMISLLKSSLTPQGAIYETLFQVPFKQNPKI